MSLQQLKKLAVKDEKVIKRIEEEHTELYDPDINREFQSFANFILKFEDLLSEIKNLEEGGNYLTAFMELKDSEVEQVSSFKGFEKKASEFMSQKDLKRLEKLNSNFKQYKEDACVELLEKSMEQGKSMASDRQSVWMKKESLEKAFDYVSRETLQTGKECAGIFIMKASSKDAVICQDFRPLKDSEVKSLEETKISYEDEFKQKLAQKEEYGYSLMHSHPVENLDNFDLRLMPSNLAHAGDSGGDLRFFMENGAALSFIISTSGPDLPHELYVSAIGMPVGPYPEKVDLRKKMMFHEIIVLDDGGRVKVPEIEMYNRLVYLYNGSFSHDIDNLYKALGKYRKILFS